MSDALDAEDVEYLVAELKDVIDLIEEDQKHMAVTKLLSHISALQTYHAEESDD